MWPLFQYALGRPCVLVDVQKLKASPPAAMPLQTTGRMMQQQQQLNAGRTGRVAGSRAGEGNAKLIPQMVACQMVCGPLLTTDTSCSSCMFAPMQGMPAMLVRAAQLARTARMVA
jgi:hypothetical protein